MKNTLWLALLLAALLSACNRTPKPFDPASAAAAKAQLDVLRDSVDTRWTQMMASDDAKIVATAQMISELERNPSTDKQLLQQLSRANSRLQARRYQQLTMQSAQIDQYDMAQDSLLTSLRGILQAPGAAAPGTTVQNTFATIGEYDGLVVGYRVQYDRAAKQFNNYLQLHRNELQSLGGKYGQLTPLPLFELQE
ncbi:hypothetical protein [Hymenobacter psychrotolerans]|uniref:LemA protein n=1 Tax=Hymenobacter psychrotolerans DSM 18569 TaxID=1121959 RepID=A0A1M6XDK2_9BACT|nr:hypothetical protein [Hymenobacter psychrotolerans]SHL03929.1 hypothetical protein SAMN02746009_02010 [Hymenobacter psychrotolerans DSM 18569]